MIKLISLGCKVNSYENNALKELFLKNGFSDKDKQDITIVNTCSVTAVADQKSRQIIRREKRLNPNAILCVMGCYSQKNADFIGKECGADIIVGTSNRNKIVEFVKDFIKNKKQIIAIDKDSRKFKYESFGTIAIPNSTRAYVKVEDGCNNFCSYCTIPYTRGVARSRDKDEIIEEISTLVENGFKEIVITGIHTAHYGLDNNGTSFSELIEEICNIKDLYRIRISSIEESEIDEKLISLMEKYPQRASISLGFVGLYETCVALIGQSNTTDEGRKLSKEILAYMNQKCYYWKEQDKINYSIYGTPEEALTYKFALANRRDFGLIEHITDKDYVVNSYHVDPRETIDAFTKLEIEGEYLALSAGGAVSYVETGDLTKNIEVIVKIIQWMYEHIVYAEINRIVGVCYECGHEGDMQLVKTENGVFQFICPHCGNTDDSKMNVKARLCGYLGQVNAGNTNKGRMDDIYNRKIHLDCYEE